jgi:pyruvate carboxylase
VSQEFIQLQVVTVRLRICVIVCLLLVPVQIRGIKTNIPFMENVLRHPAFMAGAATTGFIETYSKELFKFEGHSNIRANKLLLYLADMVSSSKTAWPLFVDVAAVSLRSICRSRENVLAQQQQLAAAAGCGATRLRAAVC